MKRKLILSMVLLWITLVVQAQNYTPVRIHESGIYDYDGTEKYNFQIKPLYSHYIEVKGEVKAGREFVVVEPNTILKEVVLGIYLPSCKLCDLGPTGQGGTGVSDGYTDRSDRGDRIYLSLATTTNTLTMHSSSSSKKIIRYIIYDSNGNMMLYNNVTPAQQIEINIVWLPPGIYYAYAVFEDYSYEGDSFQK